MNRDLKETNLENTLERASLLSEMQGLSLGKATTSFTPLLDFDRHHGLTAEGGDGERDGDGDGEGVHTRHMKTSYKSFFEGDPYDAEDEPSEDEPSDEDPDYEEGMELVIMMIPELCHHHHHHHHHSQTHVLFRR